MILLGLGTSAFGGADRMHSITAEPGEERRFSVTCLDGSVESRSLDEVASDWYCLPPHSANGVALFADRDFVSYREGDPEYEASNLAAALESMRAQVTELPSLDPDRLKPVLEGNRVLIIPPLRRRAYSVLSAESRRLIQAFVRAGGAMVTMQNNTEWEESTRLVNSIFGWRLQVDNMYFGLNVVRTPAAPAAFTDAAGRLQTHFYTHSVSKDSLPSGAVAVYRVDDNSRQQVAGNSLVTLLPYGSGAVVHMGWDWENAAPVGEKDGGWLSVLRSILALPAVEAPDPTPSPRRNDEPGDGSGNDDGHYDDEF